MNGCLAKTGFNVGYHSLAFKEVGVSMDSRILMGGRLFLITFRLSDQSLEIAPAIIGTVGN